nr:immunoglobulin light chain junction region [Macaca mulatta]MOW57165.1 immunoglobulin light chain junction region [Macaca mulatta]MOW57573.1 immunoglobulin light chain junction region [Macaca mulatta]MOW57660.1 immunoglobulin light chain junction region [Macaca mulatta]MOW57693.1 immunoglobulin light chain junction region [Macaca mulatta]
DYYCQSFDTSGFWVF